ncbi:MAG: acyltransferase [Firmicutes bacterium]|nr:acyltransferase [Bacillota bacterium]
MTKKSEISFLNTLFCLLVIFIHVASEPVSKLSRDSFSYAAVFFFWRISAFVVQGFIFLSGLKMFLSVRTKRTDYVKYCAARFKKIVEPYVFFVCVFYGYFLHKGGYFDFSLAELGKYILNGTLAAHFYFVIVIVQFYLLKPLWEKMTGNVRPIYAILLSLAVNVLCVRFLPQLIFVISGKEFAYNDRIFSTYLIYWTMGCYAGMNYNYFTERIKKYNLKICALFALAAAAEAVVSYLQFTQRISFKYIDELHMLYCCMAIIFCYAIALKFGVKLMNSRILKEINGASYYIYLLHPLLIFIANDKIAENEVISQGKAMLIRAAAAYFGSILLCIGYLKIKSKLASGMSKFK